MLILFYFICGGVAYYSARYLNTRFPHWFTAIWGGLLALVIGLAVAVVGGVTVSNLNHYTNSLIYVARGANWAIFGAIAGVIAGIIQRRKEAAAKESSSPQTDAVNTPPILQPAAPALAHQQLADTTAAPYLPEEAPPVVPFAPEPRPRPTAKETDTIQARQMEEAFYEQVATEMAARQVKKGLWAKALAQCDGSHERTKALYIKLRVQSLMDEATLKAEEERRRLELEAAEAAERERQRIEREKAIEEENRRRELEAEQQAKLAEQEWQREYEWYKHIGKATSPAHDRTPLMNAVFANDMKSVKRLIAAGEKIEATDKGGRTALDYAKQLGYTEIVHLLTEIERRRVAEIQRDYGRTPLMMAVFANDIKSVSRLIAAGAKIEATDKGGWTALNYAKQLGYTEIVRLLQAAGARR